MVPSPGIPPRSSSPPSLEKLYPQPHKEDVNRRISAKGSSPPSLEKLYPQPHKEDVNRGISPPSSSPPSIEKLYPQPHKEDMNRKKPSSGFQGLLESWLKSWTGETQSSTCRASKW
ncbi:uncharacterized protein LOC127803017 [Diospyros lotus]|uniref:uncharacterized protein LOC127803017 n=1 Tax=Diospyros lotus TaxID=55363 RepID=UPI00224CCE69|nr:uncharacterized protein LOC127803017 [Diospyros lotus]